MIPSLKRPADAIVRGHIVAERHSYASDCLPSAQQQAGRLEVLRYKWGGYKTGVRVVQQLGDAWRRFFGVSS